MEDVSKEVVAVILVIAIVISVLGTWLVLDSATSVNTGGDISSGELAGKSNVAVSLSPEPQPDIESGNIQLRITK